MEDINRIKPYIEQLVRQLQNLKPLLEKVNVKSLDEQLLLLSDERQRLDLTNKYAYLLSSLMFAYMKVINCKDISPVMDELARVKRYMASAKELDLMGEQKDQNKRDDQRRATQTMMKALTPSISRSNFQGKHIKFAENEKYCNEENDKQRNDDLSGRTEDNSKFREENFTGRLENLSTKSRKPNKISKPSKSRRKSGKLD